MFKPCYLLNKNINTSSTDKVDEAVSQKSRPTAKSLGCDEARISEAVDGANQILLNKIAHVPPHGGVPKI